MRASECMLPTGLFKSRKMAYKDGFLGEPGKQLWDFKPEGGVGRG